MAHLGFPFGRNINDLSQGIFGSKMTHHPLQKLHPVSLKHLCVVLLMHSRINLSVFFNAPSNKPNPVH
jgi:hypothetical protein